MRIPMMINSSSCKHTKHLGLCKKCQEEKTYTVFKYCDVKTCQKDQACNHAGYFYGSGNDKEAGQKKPEYPIAEVSKKVKSKFKAMKQEKATDNNIPLMHPYMLPMLPTSDIKYKKEDPISIYLLKALTILGRNNLVPPRGTMNPDVRSDLIAEGWKLLKA